MYLPTTEATIIKPKNIRKDTNVRPEKKPSTINETKMKIAISRRNPPAAHLY